MQSPDEDGLVAQLEREAKHTLESIAGRGWYRADDGTRVQRREKDRSPRFAEIMA